MLIKINELIYHLNINIKGILHIGAHECEELKDYNNAGIDNSNIYWIEAMQNKVDLWKAEQKDPKVIPFPVFDESKTKGLMEG